MNRDFMYYIIKIMEAVSYTLMGLIAYGVISCKLNNVAVFGVYFIILTYCSIKLDKEGRKWKEK